MKAFIAGMAHETNSFSPLPTSRRSFEELLVRPKTGEGKDRLGDTWGYGRFIKLATEHQIAVAPGLFCATQPSAPTIKADYEALRDEILDDLRAAMPVDMVLLMLHGAQTAQGYDDCEGDILERVRRIVGPEVPIGAELDLHANVTQKMLANATIIMACKEYPHVDFSERADDLFSLIRRTRLGEIKPVMAKFDVPMLGSFPTTRQPMRSFVDETHAMEGKDGVLSVSLVHGFAWADFPEMGASVVVVTDGNKAKAETLASTLGRRFFKMRKEIDSPLISLEAALDRATAAPVGPIVLADRSDNPGGGAPGDSTYMLQAMLDRGITDAAIAMIWDPVAVKIAFDAGVGASLAMRIGGKTGPFSGLPVDLEATVTAVRRDAKQWALGGEAPLGDAAAIRAAGIDIVLNSIRQQTFSEHCFTELGIDPKRKKILVVKSTQHFHARFQPIAKEIIYVGAPGTLSTNYLQFPFKRMRRPMAPLDPVELV